MEKSMKEFALMQELNQSGQPGTKAGGLPYKWIVAIVVIFGVFMSVVDAAIVTIGIPRFQTAFGAGLNEVQWVLTAYTLTLGVVTPTTAFFADRLGTKRFYLVALALFTAGSALCGLAWSLPVLIFFRILQGLGGAFLFPLAVTQLYRAFPLEERGLAGGVFAVAALLAPAVGPTLGGYLITYASWQWIFFINIPQEQSQQANGNIDKENPLPARIGDEVATQGRANSRCQQRGNCKDTACQATPFQRSEE